MNTIGKQVAMILSLRSGLNLSDIRMDQSLRDLGVDSLVLVETIFELEETFDIVVPFNANEAENSGLETVGSVIALVEQLVMKRAA